MFQAKSSKESELCLIPDEIIQPIMTNDPNVVYTEETIKAVSEIITKASKHVKHPSAILQILQHSLSLVFKTFYMDN